MCLLGEAAGAIFFLKWCVLMDMYCQVKHSPSFILLVQEDHSHMIRSFTLLCSYFRNPDLSWPSKIYMTRVPLIRFNVIHEVQYLQVVIISGFIQYLQTVYGSHLLYHRHFEVWQFSLQTGQAACESCQDHLDRVPARVNVMALFTSSHVFDSAASHQPAS